MSKFVKLSAPPPPPPPDLGMPPMGAPPMGMPPMGGPPMGAGGPGPGSNSNQKAIKEPLSNLGLILADANIEKLLMEELQLDERDIANKIWKMYGGNEEGGVVDGRVGKRQDDQEVSDEEIEETKNTRWKRLPLNQSLIDLEIELDDMANAVKFLSFGFAKNKSKEQGAAPGGGMPGLASRRLKNMVKLAQNLDLYGMYNIADRIM